jgi:hypothetical protein
MVVRKEISLEHNAEIIEELLSTGAKTPETVSLRKFIDINFQAFTDSRKTIREIYDFLKEKKIDVGSFHVFRSVYSKAKKSWSLKHAAPVRNPPSRKFAAGSEEHTAPESREPQKHLRNEVETDALKTKQSKYNPALPPVILPGGIEAMIDPETGAKRFEI